MIVRRLGLTVFLAVAFTCGFCTPQESTVAAAAHLQFAMQDVAARFQKETGKTVKLCGSPKCHPPRVASILFSPKREL